VEFAVGRQDAHRRLLKAGEEAQQEVMGVGGEDDALGVAEVQFAGDMALRRCDVAWDVGETRQASEDEVTGATEIIVAAGMRAPRSSVHLHAVPGGWDKAMGAVRALEDRFGMTREEARRCAFVGDSGNDAEAFAFFELSVGVANVREHLERIATPPRFVSDAPRGLGFAELVTHLLALGADRG
jgi:predicted DNA-binding protein with PD1-like motif